MARAPSEEAERSRLRRGDARRGALAPALLVLLALAQIALALGQDLSAWKGGGFGMFSTTEHGGWRVLRLAVEVPGAPAPQPVTVTPALVREARRAREHPSEAVLRRLARRVGEAYPEARAVRVEVDRTRFDPQSLEPRREPLARVRVPLGEEAP